MVYNLIFNTMKRFYKSIIAIFVIALGTTLAVAQTESTTSLNDLDATEIGIFSGDDIAVVKNAEGSIITVYSISGAVITRLQASSSEEIIDLENGIYIIQAGPQVQKVLVK